MANPNRWRHLRHLLAISFLVKFSLSLGAVPASMAHAAEAPYRLIHLFASEGTQPLADINDRAEETALTLSLAQDNSYLIARAAETPLPPTPQTIHQTPAADAPAKQRHLITIHFGAAHNISRHEVVSDLTPLLPSDGADAAAPLLWHEDEVFYALLPALPAAMLAPDISIGFEISGLLYHNLGEQQMIGEAQGFLRFDSADASLRLSLIDDFAQSHQLTASLIADGRPFYDAQLDSGGVRYEASLTADFYDADGHITVLSAFITHHRQAPILGGLILRPTPLP